MRAAYYERYGAADVVAIRDLPRPAIGPNDVLVKVAASAVTTADWRLRAAAFDGVMWLPGRLMVGLFRPRRRVLGHDFAGEVVAIGERVGNFAVGDRVMGFAPGGAHAEYLAMAQDGAIVAMPEGIGAEQAAAIPFGACTALVFLRDFAKVRAGERVLVNGASGAVGVHLVQIARLFGAHVTAVASTDNLDLLRTLGADDVVDYTAADALAEGRHYDVVVDTVGKMRFREVRRRLSPAGRFLPLEFGLTEMMQALWTRLRGGRRVIVGVSGDTREDLAFLAAKLADGSVRPVIDGVYPLARIAEAYRRVEGRHKRGSVVLSIAEDGPALRRVA